MKAFFLLLAVFVLFSTYIARAEFTGRIDIGQKPQSPDIADTASVNETVTAADGSLGFDYIPLITLAIVVLLLVASIYLIRRHIINVVP